MENSIVLVRSAIISRLGGWVMETKDASFLIFRAVLTSTQELTLIFRRQDKSRKDKNLGPYMTRYMVDQGNKEKETM